MFGAVQTFLDGVDVVVVDDDADTRELFAYALQARGAAVRVASTASEAYAALRARAPNVVIGDIAMPGEDGYSFIQRAREICPGVGAIAVTGQASLSDARRALDAGFDCHLAKPIALDELIAAIFRYARR